MPIISGVGMRRGMVVIATLGVAALLLPPGAGARVRWHDCIPIEGCEGRISVPLDRTGSVPGTTVLDLGRWKTFTGPAKRAPVMLLAGGPDVMGTAAGEGYAGSLDGVLLQGQRRVLYSFDPRGLSNADRVECRALDRPRDLDDPAKVASCAAELGPRRNLLGSRDMAADLESVRAAIEAPRMLIVAEAGAAPAAIQYTRDHPDRVEALVLLSPDPPDGPDPLSLPSLSAIPRALTALCRRGCASFTRDPAGDLAALARRVEATPLLGYTVDRRGHRHAAALGPRELLGLSLATSDDEHLRADLPGAVTAALRGDPLPVLRLVRRARLGTDDLGFEYAIHAVSACGDGRFPWDDAASPAERRAQVAAAAASLPDSVFGPLGRAAALSTRQLTTCLAWPAPRPGPLPADASVNVPAVAIFGEEDIRRPLETATALRQALPRLVVSSVGGSGEPLFSNAPEACTDEILDDFVNGRSVPPRCEHYDAPFSRPPRVDRPPPARLSDVKPYGRNRGRIGRTMTAFGLTLRDVWGEEDYVRDDAADYEEPFRGAGLRAGTFKSLSNGETLDGVEFVPGVFVSGRLGVIRDGAFFRISGRAAAHGAIRFSPRGGVTGVLDGHRVRTDIFHLLGRAELESRG